jgi:hypothetical protein
MIFKKTLGRRVSCPQGRRLIHIIHAARQPDDPTDARPGRDQQADSFPVQATEHWTIRSTAAH